MFHILDNPHFWRFFRLIVDTIFSVDKNKRKLLDSLGGSLNLPSNSILDLGCGIGNLSEIFLGEYFGIDMNLKYIQYANKHFLTEKRKFICSNVVDFVIDTHKKFDLVCLFDFAHHLPDDSLFAVLSAANKLSKKYIIIVDPVKDINNTLIIKLINKLDRGKFIRTRSHLTELIKKVGLIIINNPDGNVYLCGHT